MREPPSPHSCSRHPARIAPARSKPTACHPLTLHAPSPLCAGPPPHQDAVVKGWFRTDRDPTVGATNQRQVRPTPGSEGHGGGRRTQPLHLPLLQAPRLPAAAVERVRQSEGPPAHRTWVCAHSCYGAPRSNHDAPPPHAPPHVPPFKVALTALEVAGAMAHLHKHNVLHGVRAPCSARAAPPAAPWQRAEPAPPTHDQRAMPAPER